VRIGGGETVKDAAKPAVSSTGVGSGTSAASGLVSAGPRGERLLTIGQVVAQLKPEFPDLSITKVRYLEDRGLLSPARTPGKYRKYSTSDIRRLRTILTLQRDEYLPLEVIKERVERTTSPLSGTLVSSASVRFGPAIKREQPLYTQEELCEATGADAQFVRTLVEFRLLDRPAAAGPAFTESDLEVVRVCQALARFGIEPRNLRLIVSSIEREATLVEQLTVPSLRSTHPDKREYGERLLADLGSLLSQLAGLLLVRELRRLL
jgi:DNA-binding transcriptional MerR regulator